MLYVRTSARRLISTKQSSATPYSTATQLWCRRGLVTLAIETSCDDTAVAVLEKSSPLDDNSSVNHAGQDHIARLLFNEKITAPNTGLGGIHPIEALESHQANLSKLITKAVGHLPDVQSSAPACIGSKTISYEEGSLKRFPDFVSVTRGPGMRSNLHCGLDTAKGLAAAWQVPLIGVHHMQAHALTPRLVDAMESKRERIKKAGTTIDTKPGFPFLTLLISGGHTMLLQSNSLVDHKILASTRDIAIGDALDKCGRVLLPDSIKAQAKDTAFARYLSDYAFPSRDTYDMWPVPKRRRDEIDKPNNEYDWQIQAPMADTRELGFSFTSIASATERIFQQRLLTRGGQMNDEERKLFARTALGTAFEHLGSRTVMALEVLKSQGQSVSNLVVSGGVAANSFLRHFLRILLDVRGYRHVELLFPPPWLCTDNAAMIAWCGMEMFEAGYRSELDIGALRKWSMDPMALDGGILGVGGWSRS